MERKLIVEINRMQEIMGLKSIISESQGEAIEKLAEKMGFSFERVGDRVEAMSKYGEEVADRLKRGNMKAFEKFEQLSEKEAEQITEKEIEELLEMPGVKKTFVESLETSLTKPQFEILSRSYADAIFATEPGMEDALTQIYKVRGPEGVKKFLEKKGWWVPDDAPLWKAWKPEGVPEFKPKVETGGGKKKTSVGTEYEFEAQAARDMDYLEKRLNELPENVTPDQIMKNNTYFTQWQQMKKIIEKYDEKALEKLDADFRNDMEEFINRVKRISPTTLGTINNYLERNLPTWVPAGVRKKLSLRNILLGIFIIGLDSKYGNGTIWKIMGRGSSKVTKKVTGGTGDEYENVPDSSKTTQPVVQPVVPPVKQKKKIKI